LVSGGATQLGWQTEDHVEYDIRTDVTYGPLELIDAGALAAGSATRPTARMILSGSHRSSQAAGSGPFPSC
jgi:hypothetical protein